MRKTRKSVEPYQFKCPGGGLHGISRFLRRRKKVRSVPSLPRFYDVTGGAVKIDGKDVRDLTLKSLRDHIGIVQQDVYLFVGTVFDNIRYGKPDATREEVIEAAKNANAHEFIMSLPNGYETDIGQRGIKLSGGQKQRLSIARVFLKIHRSLFLMRQPLHLTMRVKK